MTDDDEMFERSMENLGVKAAPKNAPRKPAPPKVEVTEDLDFDAVMRTSRGPARELPATPKAKVEGQAAPAATPAPAVKARPARYTASEEEAREFLEAMAAIGSAGSADTGKDTASAERTRAPEDLATRLKRGDVAIDAVLDLHGKTRKEAQTRLADFILEARREGWEVVSIVVGRGAHSDRGEAVLRPLVERWLREEHRGEVSEVAQAPVHLGGSGAWIATIRAGRGA